eukprot:CAMPEP_0174833110 /NCGR_PEP_ID=MMETSP1114-20130205/4038_1 /TAXON_ID=312471 /ORGANISM="Neobodo designis, Strain CCAP 1951/1" /LENGTH=806 /DNA_ID=CAMNT_0016066981 /DNA_START=66 /DNA_END=2486 /DNA_ORIENTATION=-
MAEGETMYSVEQIDEPLYSMLVNAGIAEVSHSDYEVLAVTDPATTQAYLEGMASDPETYTWEMIIYTLREAYNAAAGGEGGEGAEAAAEGGEEAAAEAAEGAEGEQQYVQAYDEEGNPMYDEEGNPVYYAVDGAAADGEEQPEGEGGLDLEAQGYGEYAEGDEEAYAEEGVTELNEDGEAQDTEQAAVDTASWTCTKCTFVNKVIDAAVCAVCRVPRTCEQEGPGHVERNAEGRTELKLRSDMLKEKSKYLKGQFKVVKYNADSILSGKKDRLFEIDFFKREFRNCSTGGTQSFALQSANLYRVERHISNPLNLKLLFFKSPHPIDLIFPTCADRQRFVEVAALQRKNPVVWAPNFCRENVKESIVKIEGNKIDRGGKSEPAEGTGMFIASRMPYEVLSVWAGTINLQFRGLPNMGEKLEEFCPMEHDVYVLGLQDVPSSMRDGKQIQEFFTAFFGQNFYLLLNTSSDSNVFAGIEGRKGDKNPPGAVVVVVRRNVLAKVANIDFFEMNEPGQSGKKNKETSDVYGVFVALRIQETTIGVLLANLTPNLTDVNARNGKLQMLMSRIKCHDPLIDISVRFDYFFVLGSLGYHTLPTDELHAQVQGQLVLTDFKEWDILADMCLPDRVLYWHRARSAKASQQQYSTAPHLGMPNILAVFDLYVLRPYCYALCPDVPPARITISSVKFDCDTLQGVRDAELRIAGEWFESGVVSAPLKISGSKLVADTVPALTPVTPAYEFLRAQSVCVSLLGIAEGVTRVKGALIASAVTPLRDMLIPDTPMNHSAFMMRLGTVIGIVELTVTYVTRK